MKIQMNFYPDPDAEAMILVPTSDIQDNDRNQERKD